jgi:hypothetical protein
MGQACVFCYCTRIAVDSPGNIGNWAFQGCLVSGISTHYNLLTRHEAFRPCWAYDSHFLFFLQTRNDDATNQLMLAMKALGNSHLRQMSHTRYEEMLETASTASSATHCGLWEGWHVTCGVSDNSATGENDENDGRIGEIPNDGV